jgi:hypothetical protein
MAAVAHGWKPPASSGISVPMKVAQDFHDADQASSNDPTPDDDGGGGGVGSGGSGGGFGRSMGGFGRSMIPSVTSTLASRLRRRYG